MNRSKSSKVYCCLIPLRNRFKGRRAGCRSRNSRKSLAISAWVFLGAFLSLSKGSDATPEVVEPGVFLFTVFDGESPVSVGGWFNGGLLAGGLDLAAGAPPGPAFGTGGLGLADNPGRGILPLIEPLTSHFTPHILRR